MKTMCFTPIMGCSVSYLLVLALVALTFNYAEACSCALNDDFQRSYYSSQQRGTPYSFATVLSTTIFPTDLPKIRSSGVVSFHHNQNRVFQLLVTKVFDHCAPSVPYEATAISSVHGSLCGISLETGVSYMLPLKPGAGQQTEISLCRFITPLKRLDKDKKEFLNSRKLFCTGHSQCADGTSQVACKVAPCDVSKPPCPEAIKCVDNYCGGCNAEWFDKDNLPGCRPLRFPFSH